jgi:hypothetical protein
MISTCKQALTKRASQLFARGNKASVAEDAQKVVGDLHRKIGQVQLERGSCQAARHLPPAERRTMIAPNAELPISQQCMPLGIASAASISNPGRRPRRA